MKIIIIGANGQLGTSLCHVIKKAEVICVTNQDIDIADIKSVRHLLNKYKPDIVINTASFVRVDDCELEIDKAFSVNAQGARNVAEIANQLGAKLVHISTDYVFGEESETRSIPYTEFDTPVPCNVYGKSKLAGEDFVRNLCNRHFIIRASALFGTGGSRGKDGNFVETVLRLASEKNELRIVQDQIFSPTYTSDLAQKIVQLMVTDYYGIFHITNKGSCSWYEFTVEILKLAGQKTPIIPITSDQYPQKARSPRYSVLDNYCLRLLGMDDMRPWQEALKDYLKEQGHLML